METTTPHGIETKAPGKYDCGFDKWVHEETLSWSDGFGDVNDYGLYVSSVTLDPECEGHPDDDHSIAAGMVAGESHYCDGTCTTEGRAAQHYGTPYLLILEDRQGFIVVHPFATEDERDTEYQRMEKLYDQWSERADSPGESVDLDALPPGSIVTAALDDVEGNVAEKASDGAWLVTGEPGLYDGDALNALARVPFALLRTGYGDA